MRKILGITMGDPAGVGPEITVRALQDPKVYESCKPLVVGDAAILERACGFVGAKCTIHPVADPSEGLYEHGVIDILDLGLLRPEDLAIGQVSAAAGDAAFRYVRKVIELAMDGKVDATVTNPLNKEAMNLAGHHFSGHTEIYAHYTGTEHYTMMLAHNDLRVVHVSTHVSLREACDRVKKDRVLEVISIQSLPGHGHRKTPHRCGGPQSPLRRGRTLRTGGNRRDRSSHRGSTHRGYRRPGAYPAGHDLLEGFGRLV